MTKDTLVNQNAYKIFAIIGILTVLATIFLSWTHASKLEPYAAELFERNILTQLDLDSLNQQFQSLQRAINSSENSKTNPEAVRYSEKQLKQLVLESENLHTQIEDLNDILGKTTAEKNNLIRNIKIALVLSIAGLVLGMVFTVFGCLGWYFDIKVFEERRTEPRE